MRKNFLMSRFNPAFRFPKWRVRDRQRDQRRVAIPELFGFEKEVRIGYTKISS
jgi:hypothetical protein